MVKFTVLIDTIPNQPGDDPRREELQILITPEFKDISPLQDQAACLIHHAISEASKVFGEAYAQVTTHESFPTKPSNPYGM